MAARRAVGLASDPSTRGWATLVLVDALAEQDLGDDALGELGGLYHHEDPEIALSAALRQAQVLGRQEAWAEALKSLSEADASTLGPAWDASVVEQRSSCLLALGQPEAAREEWRSLMARWPNEEEAKLPAYLALSELARGAGDRMAARALARQVLTESSDAGYRARAEEILARLGG
jgi:predicted negative regulator of RcsB-dependent stress response